MMITKYEFCSLPIAVGMRLDQYLVLIFPSYSRSMLQKNIKLGKVCINNVVEQSAKYKIKSKDKIEVELENISKTELDPENIKLNIVFEDDDIIIVDKPVGLISHPGAGNPRGTLVNALLHHDIKLADLPRAGLIHRLDKDTSGLLIIAKNINSYNKLVVAMQEREINRSYFAIVQGALISGGEVDAPIGRHPKLRTKMAVVATGRQAQTSYRINEKFPAHTAIVLQLHTGRTHQIRVHMQHIRVPLVGDQTYKVQKTLDAKISDALKVAIRDFRRQALHAMHLDLVHPVTGVALSFDSPLPDDIQQLIQALRADKDRH
jgi:23S rRNA pseudouridine1911/1915/1917 synthase